MIARQIFDEAEARYMAAKAAYDLAVQQVENMRASMHQNQAALNLANKKLRDAHIYAPFAGHVKVRSVTTGQYLKVQAPVMTIVNVDPLRVRLSVPENTGLSVICYLGRTTLRQAKQDPGQAGAHRRAGARCRSSTAIPSETAHDHPSAGAYPLPHVA